MQSDLMEESVTPEEPPPVPRAARRLNVLAYRNWYFLFSLLIILPGIYFMVTKGFLLGIDFKGGTEFTVAVANHPSLAQVQDAVNAAGIRGTVQSEGQDPKTHRYRFIVRTDPVQPGQYQGIRDKLRSKLTLPSQDQDSFPRTDEVGAAVAQETVTKALAGVLVASFLILAYLAYRFRKVEGGFRSGLQFGGSALLALLHDVALLAGVFSILGRGLGLRIGEIDGLFVTAVLTVVGFSVHDTIVVFDRIRENMIVARRLSFEQVANLSIMQTAARSIITSFTVVLVLLAMLLFGGEALRGFILAFLIGIISGTYSSIFNATPLLVVWRRLAATR